MCLIFDVEENNFLCLLFSTELQNNPIKSRHFHEELCELFVANGGGGLDCGGNVIIP